MLGQLMTNERSTLVDFVAKESDNEWQLVLVEEGPWDGPIDGHLSRIQDRLYGCLDAALDGKVYEQFPDSKGKNIVIQLDCYNVPKAEVSEFFDRFSNGVLATPDYQSALKGNKYVRDVKFRVTFDSIH